MQKALNGSQIPRGVLPKEIDKLLEINVESTADKTITGMPSLKKKLLNFNPLESTIMGHSDSIDEPSTNAHSRTQNNSRNVTYLSVYEKESRNRNLKLLLTETRGNSFWIK